VARIVSSPCCDLHDRLQKEIDEGKEAQADLVSSLERINKERAEDLEEYKSSIEARMREMSELREQLDKVHDGSREAEEQQLVYKKQIEELRENLETVKRRQPGKPDATL
jgi:ERCC4-type nuclease